MIGGPSYKVEDADDNYDDDEKSVSLTVEKNLTR